MIEKNNMDLPVKLSEMSAALQKITDPRMFFALFFYICRKNLQFTTNLLSSEISISKKNDLINSIQIFDENNKFILTQNIRDEYFEDENNFCIFLTAVLKKFDTDIFTNSIDTQNYSSNKSGIYFYKPFNLPAEFKSKRCCIIPIPKTIISDEIIYARNQKNTYTNMFGFVENCIVLFLDEFKYDLKIEPISKKNKFITNLLENKSNLKIGVSSICKDIDYELKIYEECKVNNSVPFCFSGISSPSRIKMKKLITEILAECKNKNTDIVIFPELTVDNDILHTISQWLLYYNKEKIIKIIIAGSFHFESEKMEKQPIKFPLENRCAILSYNGEILWQHTKLQIFKLIADNLKKNPDFSKINNIPEDVNELPEHIGIGNKLQIIDSPIGRIVVLICLDFLEPDINYILTQTYSNLIFIPAMTKSIDPFKDYSDKLSLDCNAIVFLSNSCWLRNSFGKSNNSFYSIPVKDKTFTTVKCANIPLSENNEEIKTEIKKIVEAKDIICKNYCLDIIEIP